MSTLYIRIPSRVVADSAPNWIAMAFPFALASDSGAIELEGVEPLSNLSATIAKTQHMALILDGGNVTVLRVKVPPLSAAKLKLALPNLVEEHLLCDPSECVIVAGRLSDGLRTIAVMQRAWLELLSKTFVAFGARHITALPAQLCLSAQAGSATAAVNEWNADTGITLRLPEQDGIGLTIGPISQSEHGRADKAAAAAMAIDALCAAVPAAPVTLYVPQLAMRIFQEAAKMNSRINVLADNWPHWIAGARAATLDLMAGLGTGSGDRLDWLPWRWPLVLSGALLVFNAAVLNIGWWHMKDEADTLHTSMVHIYKSAYPGESVIIDPLAQMQQKIASARRDSGLVAPDDFTALIASFGEAWADVTATTGKPPAAIAEFEYRERSLFVHLKPVLSSVEGPVLSSVEGPAGEAATQAIKTALVKHDLSLELAPAQPGAIVWRIGSLK